jgi:hypothetical protein
MRLLNYASCNGGHDGTAIHGPCGQDPPIEADRGSIGGDDIVIAKGSKPVVRLVAITSAKFKVGLLKGKLGARPGFFEPLGDAELEGWEGGA